MDTEWNEALGMEVPIWSDSELRSMESDARAYRQELFGVVDESLDRLSGVEMTEDRSSFSVAELWTDISSYPYMVEYVVDERNAVRFQVFHSNQGTLVQSNSFGDIITWVQDELM